MALAAHIFLFCRLRDEAASMAVSLGVAYAAKLR